MASAHHAGKQAIHTLLSDQVFEDLLGFKV